jgi:PAS domain S-box-containing protein
LPEPLVRRSREALKSSLLRRLRRGQARLEATDPQRLVRELQQSQVELELQNRELAETRARLEAACDRYADLYESAPVAYFTIDRRAVIHEINQTGAALLSRRRDQLIGTPLLAAARVADKEPLCALLAATCDRGERAAAELTLIAGKRQLTVQLASVPVAGAQGARLCRVTLTDISERKRAEAELRRAHAEAEAAQARATFLSDASAQLTAALPEVKLDIVARLFVPRLAEWCIVELSDERLRAASDELLAVAHADAARLEALTRLARQHPSPLDDKSGAARLRALGHNAVVAPIVARQRRLGALTFAPAQRPYDKADRELLLELGRRVGAVLDHAQLWRELRRAARAHDEMLRLVAHDLGNSLAAVRLEALLLQMRAGEAEIVKARAQSLDRSADYMMRLIGDLVDLGSDEMDELPMVQRPDDAGALVREAVARLQPEIEAKPLQLTVELPDAPLAIDCDHDRIGQVLLNLIGNAIKFTAPKGKITVRAEELDGEVVFTVQDTGRGIAAKDMPHVFARRWRAQPDLADGYGLGLYIARGIVEAHRGRIWVQSRLGRGSRFHFALPAASP